MLADLTDVTLVSVEDVEDDEECYLVIKLSFFYDFPYQVIRVIKRSSDQSYQEIKVI